MTKSAEVNAQIEKDKEIADKNNKTKEEIADKDRTSREKENEKDRTEKRKDRFAHLATGAMRMFKINDASFYKAFVTDLDKFVNLPTVQRLGAEYYATKLLGKYPSGLKHAVPGIMIINFVPTVGNQDTAINIAETPINQSLMRSKEQVLKSNSRSSTNWEPSDYGLNIICTTDIMTEFHEIKRVLLVYQTYDGSNSYLAKDLIEALGYDYDDLVDNFADYKKQLCTVAKRINSSIICPKDVTLVKRRLYLVNNIFLDTGDFKNVKQMYLYKQEGYMQLSLAGDSAAFVRIPSGGNGVKLSDVFNNLYTNIQRITENPDYIEMYQDLRHAFSTNIFTVEETFDTSKPMYFNTENINREQIHNIITLPQWDVNRLQLSDNSLGIHQDSNGYLVQGNSADPTTRVLEFYSNSGSISHARFQSLERGVSLYYGENGNQAYLLDTYHRPITGDDILDITRGLFTLGEARSSYPTEGDNYIQWQIKSCGTEIFTKFIIYTKTAPGTTSQTLTATTGHTVEFEFSTTDKVSVAAGLSFVCEISKFDWSPQLRLVSLKESLTEPISNITYKEFLFFEMENSFIINFDDLSRVNEACVLSEFYLANTSFRVA